MAPQSTDPKPVLSLSNGVGVAVVAAGQSTRMRGVDKQFATIAGRPLLARSLETFDRSPSVNSISVATSVSRIEAVQDMVREYGFSKVLSVVEGGARRQDSVLNAVRALGNMDIVLIHDGARPFMDQPTIERAVAAASEWGAASAAVPVKDTIKVVDSDLSVVNTPLRDHLWAAQTPQAFRLDLLLRAHSEVSRDVTDDAAMVEAIGHPVKLFMGSYLNLKVTTPEDLLFAEAIAGMAEMKEIQS
jgi:2-C-methyl-D-erythritol 4-phosphate cytidylyltransferase